MHFFFLPKYRIYLKFHFIIFPALKIPENEYLNVHSTQVRVYIRHSTKHLLLIVHAQWCTEYFILDRHIDFVYSPHCLSFSSRLAGLFTPGGGSGEWVARQQGPLSKLKVSAPSGFITVTLAKTSHTGNPRISVGEDCTSVRTGRGMKNWGLLPQLYSIVSNFGILIYNRKCYILNLLQNKNGSTFWHFYSIFLEL